MPCPAAVPHRRAPYLPVGILISPTPVEEAPLWRPPLPVPHPAPLSYLLLNAEAAVDTLRRYYAGLLRPGELDVDDFQAGERGQG
mgnify:CR=1 FL=1